MLLLVEIGQVVGQRGWRREEIPIFRIWLGLGLACRLACLVAWSSVWHGTLHSIQKFGIGLIKS